MDLDALWRGFCSPPDDARPRAWWHWMDGNVDPEGIRLDLEWLQRIGVRGVQMFDGGMGTPLVVPERVRHGSPEWRTSVRQAASTAHRLGLEFTVATSAGWSAAGGPWVEPVDAMKKVVWSETRVEGGRAIEVRLEPLPDVAGPYQDCPGWGADPAAHRYAWDWVAVAVPAEQTQSALTPSRVDASDPLDDWSSLVDGSYGASVSLTRDPDGPSSAWIEQVFDGPVTVGAVTVGLPGPRGFGAAPPPSAVLEASDDGVGYRVVAMLPEVVVPAAKAVPVRTAAFAPVSASRFRLTFSGTGAADALPLLAPGVRLPPVLRRVSEFVVTEFALFPGGRIHQAEVKAGFAAAPDYYVLDTDPAVGPPAIDPAQVQDVTAQVDAQGVLRWEAPAGSWLILRFGASLTGQTNGPAPPEATGLEVDKLDAARVHGYLATYLALFDEALGEEPTGRVDALLSDSIESGPQNFTERLRAHFAELRGYDPTPWLPALTGRVVGDASRSDRFLWDHRRTIADLLAREYYGAIKDAASARGLVYYAEALEDHRPQLGDDLAMRSHADVPMGAMWTFDAGQQPNPTYVADLRGASSVAHVYGKPFTGAESMSAFHRPWSYTPRRLKNVADLELALGVTRFCIHTSPHQPTQVPPPGIGLSPYLGQTFIRTEPWAEMAAPWVDYLARCSWLLNQGVPAVDVAVFVGEEGPLTALFGDRVDDSVPAGFDHDYVNLDALDERFTVVDGVLSAGTARYRVLYLGGSSGRLSVRALRRISALVEAGATVVGRRPAGSPSLADDDEHERLCARLWTSERDARGRAVDTAGLTAALTGLGLTPALTVEGADLHRIGRRMGSDEIVFLANPRPEAATVTVRTSSGVAPVAWDPVSLTRQTLRPGTDGHDTAFRLTLPPTGSVFLVQGGPADPAGETSAEVVLDGSWQLSLPGIGAFTFPDGPRPWTEMGEGPAGFSGVGTYRTQVRVSRALLDGAVRVLLTAEVGDIAQVRVNEQECGVLWAPPFRLDVTTALRAGENVVELRVANAWMNRLIAEAATPTGNLFTPAASVYAGDAVPQASGVLGRVLLEIVT